MASMHQLVRDFFGDIFLNSQGKVGNEKYKDNFALIGASYCGDIDVISDLLKKGVDINFVDDYGRTALYFACSCGQTQVVKMLLDAGADKDIKDYKKRTALEMARKYGYQDIVALLNDVTMRPEPIKITGQNQFQKNTHDSGSMTTQNVNIRG